MKAKSVVFKCPVEDWLVNMSMIFHELRFPELAKLTSIRLHKGDVITITVKGARK
jgi:hypothetical protein